MLRSKSTHFAAAAWLLGVLAIAPLAHGQSAEDKENAQSLYKAANDARDAGDLKGAEAKYKVAYALVQTPVLALALGKSELAIGHLIEGRQVLLGVDQLPLKPNESALTTTARTEAASLAASVEPRIPNVLLKIARPAGAAAPAVTVDGIAIPEVALDVPRKVNPGDHVVVATVGAVSTEVKFDVAESSTKEVPVEYPAAAAPVAVPVVVAPVVAPPVAPPPPPPPPPPPESSHASRAPGIAILSIGVVGVGVATAFGILALGNQSSLNGECAQGKTSCPPSAQGDINSLHTNALISDVALGVGIAGVGVGALLLILRRSDSSPPAARPAAMRVQPVLSFGSLGLKGTF
jgi:hypothetical protein